VIGVACALAAVITACGSSKSNAPGQVMARVNDAEITVHQVNAELAKLGAQGIAKDEKTTRRVVDALIDQQLLVEQAIVAKLDRDPQVLQALESARRQILSQAYLERNVKGPGPTADEVRNFYAQYPALFQKRRIYSFRDYAVDRAQLTDALREKLDDPRARSDLAGTFKAANVSYSEASNVRGAEQLPIDMLPKIAAMNKGEITILSNGNTAVVMQLVEFSEQPVTLDKAIPFIEQYLMNARKKQSAESKLKELRAAAKITYLGASSDEQDMTKSEPVPPPRTTSPDAAKVEKSSDHDFVRKGVQGLIEK
jgi:EpsD family peptidyl-prolyl cis-trans isomerase